MFWLVEFFYIELSFGDDFEFEFFVFMKFWIEEYLVVVIVDFLFVVVLVDIWNWIFFGVFVGGSVRILFFFLEVNIIVFLLMVFFDCFL